MVLPALERVDPVSYEDLVKTFGFTSPAQASNALITAKRMSARLLQDVVVETVEKASDVEAEIRELREILSHADAGRPA